MRWHEKTAGSVGIFQHGQLCFILIFCFFSIKEKEKTGKELFFGVDSDIGRVKYQLKMRIRENCARAGIGLNRKDDKENKQIFFELKKLKDEIEENFGGDLIWRSTPDRKSSKICIKLNNIDPYDEDNWDQMINFYIDSVIRLERAFKEPLLSIKKIYNY